MERPETTSPTSPPRRVFLLLGAALGLLACEPLREFVAQQPTQPYTNALVLNVTLDSTEPRICRAGQEVTISATVEGGAPDEVALFEGDRLVEILSEPYRFTVDCGTFPEGAFSFQVKARRGSEVFESLLKPVVVDRTAPGYSSWRPSMPLPSVNEPVEILFSEPLDSRSIQEGSILLRNEEGASVPFQASLSEDGTTLRLMPNPPLTPPYSLSVELSDPLLTDRAGNPIPKAIPFYPSFSYWPFTTARPVPSDGIIHWADFSSDPRRVERVMAWTETQALGEKPLLVVARWKERDWERLPPPRTETERILPAIEPKVAMDKAGRIVLAWSEGPFPYFIYVKRFDGTGWQSLGTPSPAKGGGVDGLTMVLDENGEPILAWSDGDDIFVARWEVTHWNLLGSPLSANSEKSTPAQYPAVATEAGMLMLAWSEIPVGETQPHLIVWDYQKEGWKPVGALRSNAGASGFATARSALAIKDGWVFAAWAEGHSETRNHGVYLSIWDLSDTWSPPEAVQAPMEGGSIVSRPPRVVVDSDRAPWVAWTRSGGQYSSEHIVFRKRGLRGWEPERLVGPGTLVNFQLDRLDHPWAAVWRRAPPEGLVLTRPQ